MKIDFEQIKRYLEVIESSDLPVINTVNLFRNLGYDARKNEDCHQVIFYMQLLKDQGLIECVSENDNDKQNLGFSYTGNSEVIINILNFRLTILGHQSLESINNDTIWDKIKNPIAKLGVEGLKQIPSLAIKLLLS